jgi:hypothetical protein
MRVPVAPTTQLGRFAVGLALAAPVLVMAWTILPGGAALGFASGVAGGVVALRAILRHRERAVSVFAATLPLVLVVAFVLAELLIGHE